MTNSSGRVLDEQQAIHRLKHKDISGLEFLVYRYQVKAVRTAFLITGDLGLAEDVVQDSFIRAYHAIRGFDGSRPFEPWFLRSVVNAAVNCVQKRGRLVQVKEGLYENLFAEIAARVETVEAQIVSAEFQRHVWATIQKLSPRQRAVIVQRYFLEMSEKEMAVKAGTAIGTVKWLLNAARERLRSLLAERSEE